MSLFTRFHLLRPLVVTAIFLVALLSAALSGTAGAQALTISSVTGNRFPIDSNKCLEGPRAMYIGYSITNPSGTASVPLEATLSVATTGFGLAGNQPATQYVGSLSAGAKRTLFWYVTYPCTYGSSAPFTLQVKNAVTGAVLSTGSSTYTTFSMISAAAGGEPQGIVDVSGAVVGQLIVRESEYSVGNIGSNNEALFQPAGNLDFKADCLQLVSTKVISSAVSGVTVNTTDSVYFTNVSSTGSGNIVKIRYSFIYTGVCSNQVKALPFAYAGSGTQIKYRMSNGTDPGTYFTFPVSTNAFSITKAASVAAVAPGGDVTYTVTVRNTSATYGAFLQKVTDVLPAGATLKSVTAPAGSAGSIVTPSTLPQAGATGTITFLGTPGTYDAAPPTSSFYLPSGGTLTLFYTLTLPTTPGDYVNSATATTGASSVGPASVTVAVGQPDLTLTKTPVLQFARPSTAGTGGERTISFTLTVSNAGKVPSSGQISVVDTLPSGITPKSISSASTDWTCTASTLTCTYTKALAAGASAPAITVVVVAPLDTALESASTLRSFVNSAVVSGGGQVNTSNDSASATVRMVYLKLSKEVRNVTVSPGGTFSTSASGTPGQALEYCITFTNYGGVAVSNASVIDDVPLNTTPVLNGYGVTGANPALGIQLSRNGGAPTLLTSTDADTDGGSLLATGGTNQSGQLRVVLGTVGLGETGRVCFRAAIR